MKRMVSLLVIKLIGAGNELIAEQIKGGNNNRKLSFFFF